MDHVALLEGVSVKASEIGVGVQHGLLIDEDAAGAVLPRLDDWVPVAVVVVPGVLKRK